MFRSLQTSSDPITDPNLSRFSYNSVFTRKLKARPKVERALF